MMSIRLLMGAVLALAVALVTLAQNVTACETELCKLQDRQQKALITSYDELLALIEAAQGADAQATVTASQTHHGKRLEYPIGHLASLARIELANCQEDHFRLLVDLRKKFQPVPLGSFVRGVITRQRRFCEAYLDEQADSRVAAFSEPTRRLFELFLAHDRIGHDVYVSPEVSIGKLRQIVQLEASSDNNDQELQQQQQQQQVADYLEGCGEITQALESLVPIRADHDIFARLPMSCDRFFRAHEFCRHLVHFDFSEELARSLLLDVQARTEISLLGQHLAVHDNQLEAAVGGFVSGRTTAPGSNPSNVLERLRSACASGLELTEQFRWLREHSPEHTIERAQQPLTVRAREYLGALTACQSLLDGNSLGSSAEGYNKEEEDKKHHHHQLSVKSIRRALKKLLNHHH